MFLKLKLDYFLLIKINGIHLIVLEDLCVVLSDILERKMLYQL